MLDSDFGLETDDNLYLQARVHYQQDLAICREVDDSRGEGWTSVHLGLVACYQGNHGETLEHARCALSIYQSLDSSQGQAESLTAMGHALTGLSRLDQAASAYWRTLELWRTLGQPDRATEALAGLARVSLGQGDTRQAQAYAGEVLSHLEAHVLPRINDIFWVY